MTESHKSSVPSKMKNLKDVRSIGGEEPAERISPRPVRFRMAVGALALGYVALAGFSCEPDSSQSGKTEERRADKPEPTPQAGKSKPSTGLSGYRIVADETQDTPGKSQVLLRVVVPQKPTKPELRALLQSLFDTAKQRRGFKYRQHPNAVYVYAYGPNTEPNGAAWIGMLRYNENVGDPGPYFRIPSSRLEAAYEAPTEKAGLSEQQRKRVFWELVAIEDRAMDVLVEGTAAESDRIQQQGERELRQKYGLTKAQVQAIKMEGATKSWPMP